MKFIMREEECTDLTAAHSCRYYASRAAPFILLYYYCASLAPSPLPPAGCKTDAPEVNQHICMYVWRLGYAAAYSGSMLQAKCYDTGMLYRLIRPHALDRYVFSTTK